MTGFKGLFMPARGKYSWLIHNSSVHYAETIKTVDIGILFDRGTR